MKWIIPIANMIIPEASIATGTGVSKACDGDGQALPQSLIPNVET